MLCAVDGVLFGVTNSDSNFSQSTMVRLSLFDGVGDRQRETVTIYIVNSTTVKLPVPATTFAAAIQKYFVNAWKSN